jgi:TatA/E family protein of Tat protein translocase
MCEEQSMIGSLGVPELLFILVLALLVFGPRKLPEIGRTLGRAMGEFRRATSDLKRTLDVELSSEELSKPPSTVAPVPQPTATVTSEPSPTSEEPSPAQEPQEPARAEVDETRESSE